MKLFAWFDNYSFQIVVLAHNMDEARKVALTKLGTTDGSCANRQRVIDRVRMSNPDVWTYNPVCFTAISEGENDEVHFG